MWVRMSAWALGYCLPSLRHYASADLRDYASAEHSPPIPSCTRTGMMFLLWTVSWVNALVCATVLAFALAVGVYQIGGLLGLGL